MTGGAVRIGRAIALELAEAGCDVALHYRSSPGEAREAARRIASAGVRVAPVRADLASPRQIEALVARVVRALGRLDYVVGSASSFVAAPLAKTDAAVFDAALAVNARASFLLVRAAAAELRRRRGRVVLLSDLSARQGWPGHSAHAVSKAALEGTVRALARELAPEVSVNGIAPGAILPAKGMTRRQFERIVSQVPLRRSGTPEEIARAVRFFCEGPAYVTGQILAVDGGRSLV